MKFKQILLFFLLFSFQFPVLDAQEHLEPLRTNPALVRYAKKAKEVRTFFGQLLGDSIMAKLPFLDDFSHGGPYPNDSLWMDNAAFINNTYPVCPPTIGVATLDGVNSEGQPYNPNCPPGSSLPADSLTSRPIDLTYNYSTHQHNLGPGDSLWLSFYYQPGGKGYLPLPNDSLLLQIRTSSIPWTTIWYHLGYNPSANDTGFHLVMLPLTSGWYFDPNFQFRFKNYACTSGNVDQWNIDEVFLDQNRTFHDSTRADVSFVYAAPTLLANYQYMPWEQFTANDLRDSMFIDERNNSTALIPVYYRDTIPAVGSSYPVSTYYHGGLYNMNPFDNNGYSNNRTQTHIPVKSQFNYTALNGPADITMTQILSTPGDFIPWNDTIKFDQIFSDYYAYDDGSAEAAYFINGNTPMDLAYSFTLNHADTLEGLEMYFNYIFVNPDGYSMALAVWDNTGPGGSPGNLLFEDTSIVHPRISDTLDGFTFYPYHFPSAAAATFSGTFYVGWVQTYGDSLNIGYDFNTDHHDKIYYNDGSNGWQEGTYAGSMMMRPVFGKFNSHTHLLPEGSLATKDSSSYQTFGIYPNPANDIIRFSSPMPANTIVKVYSADGRECLNNSDFLGNSIDISSLPAGFYILECIPPAGDAFYRKLLIQR